MLDGVELAPRYGTHFVPLHVEHLLTCVYRKCMNQFILQ